MGNYPARYWHKRKDLDVNAEPLPRTAQGRQRAMEIRRIFLEEHRGHATIPMLLAVCRARDLVSGLTFEEAPIKAALRPICSQNNREIDWGHDPVPAPSTPGVARVRLK